jgi:hypothetical protein
MFLVKLQVDRASDRAHELEVAILRTEEERDKLQVGLCYTSTHGPHGQTLLHNLEPASPSSLYVCAHVQAALEAEKTHFEEIIGALRAEGEEKVAAVHSELEGARNAAGAEAAKRTELEARLRELEVSGEPSRCILISCGACIVFCQSSRRHQMFLPC